MLDELLGYRVITEVEEIKGDGIMDEVYESYISEIDHRLLTSGYGGLVCGEKLVMNNNYLSKRGISLSRAIEKLSEVKKYLPLILSKREYVIAGGYVLGALLGDIPKDSDIDVFILDPEFTMSDAHIPPTSTIMKVTDRVVEYVFPCGRKVQIIKQNIHSDAVSVIEHFDLSVVQVGFHMGKIYTYVNTIEDIINRVADLYPGTRNISDREIVRIDKYKSRGYRVVSRGVEIDENNVNSILIRSRKFMYG